MNLIIKYWQSDSDFEDDRMTIATIPITGVGDAIQVVKNWYRKIHSWEVKI